MFSDDMMLAQERDIVAERVQEQVTPKSNATKSTV